MYESYWQLSRKPFENIVDARSYYPSEVHQGALLKLRYGIENRRGAVLLSGAAGLGKTLLVDALRRQAPETIAPFIHLVFPQMPADQLLAYLAGELAAATGINIETSSLQHSVRGISQILAENTRAGRHAVVVVDEAHLLTGRDGFETLRLLLNFETDGQPGLTLLIAGQTGLLPQLDRMPGLEQRLGVKCLLRPFNLEETVSYISHRLTAAEASRQIFDSAAMEAVYHLTHGVPREINRLCDLSLLIAYAEEQPAVTAQQVEAVSAELVTVAPE
jgi:type II secretory pathway predicted ATPase ExeA